MSRTPTLPPNDRAMWRKMIARCHPDSGGEHDLFIWSMATRDVVCGGELGSEIPRRHREPSSATGAGPDRVPFDSYADHDYLTDRAVRMADGVAEPFASLLLTLETCYPAEDGQLYYQQRKGASYKQLAYIAHLCDMSKSERRRFYRIAESIPLSQRHAGHLINRLQERAA